jgi:RNA ligase-like protein
MSSWHSYPSIYNFGHRALTSLFDGPVIVQEKVDGSQFSFGRFEGVLRFRSKGKEIYAENPEALFVRALESVLERSDLLHDGWTYRGEYLQKPKHNALAYDRTPVGHIILFDINTAEETYLPYHEAVEEACRIGLEYVPLLERPEWNQDSLAEVLGSTSVLGGQPIEGLVFKNYAAFGPDKKALMGKHVSEAFREIHAGEWRKANPLAADVVQALIASYRTPARWQKAVQHLRDEGTLQQAPQDIGALMKEVGVDVLKEEKDEIRDALFKWAWPKIQRGITAGLPEWYKDQLIAVQFSEVSGE